MLYTGHVKEPGLSCVVGAPVSCTGPLIENNNLYVPKPEQKQYSHNSSIRFVLFNL